MVPSTMKDKVLNVAEKRMVKFGYRKVTMDEIAQDLKVSKNTIYKEFTGKEEIAQSLVKRLQHKMNEGLAQIEKKHTDPLMIFADSVVLLRKDLGPWFEHFFKELPVELPHLWDDFLRYRNEKILEIQALVDRGIKQGVFRDVNASIAVQAYLGSVKAIVSPKFLEEQNISFHQALDAALDIWAHGILKKRNKR
jgi:AcrR family transcriptional regulator